MPAKKSPKKPHATSKKTVAKKAAPAKKKTVVAARHAAKSVKKPAAKPAAPKAVTKAKVAKTPAKPVPIPITKPAAKPIAAAKKAAEKAPRPVAAPMKPPVPAPKSIEKPDSLRNNVDAEEADASDVATSSSLLSGPRNVTPYTPKRGEQYMSKEQLEHFRTILLSWKRDLMEEVDRTVLHMKDEAANFPDPNDRATQESEFSLELRTRDRERKLIRKIDSALSRIDDGSYGYCVETGEEIGIKRLEARPVATLCVEAQERRERREKQYGDRDDRYR